MKNKIISYTLLLALIVIIICVITPMKAYADIGPKPSVVIDFIGLENESYYVTLLSQVNSTGPYSTIDYMSYYERYNSSDYEIWLKFGTYDDKDGYYFLNYFTDCTETSRYAWSYWPPHEFKILLYFPEYDNFIVSEEVYEKYALHSYYTVDVKDLDLQSATVIDSAKVVKSYDYTWELISLFARIIATIIIEVLIALLFGFRTKQHLLIIGAVNIVTQLILNILLSITNYYLGSMIFVFNYVWLEALIIIIEAKAYFILFSKYNLIEPTQKGFVTLYAFIANVASFGIGLYIAYLIPGIF